MRSRKVPPATVRGGEAVLSLSIVIVNWNSGNQLRECLASVPGSRARLTPDQRLDQVVVVDNGSDDGSADGLALDGTSLQVVRNGENRGFAAACNQGAARVSSDFVLFLNPDTRLFADSLAVPAAALQRSEHEHTGIAGIQLVDLDGTIARCCARFPRARHFASHAVGLDRIIPRSGQAMREWDHASTRPVDQVIGAFFLVRRSLFTELGGFDERFFVYFEEVDLALRAREKGWACVFVAEARACHVGGGTSRQVKAKRLFYSLRSRLLYGEKHFGRGERAALHAVTWVLEPACRVSQLALARRFGEIADVCEAYRMLRTDYRSRIGSTK